MSRPARTAMAWRLAVAFLAVSGCAAPIPGDRDASPPEIPAAEIPVPLLLPGTVEPSGSSLSATSLEDVRRVLVPRPAAVPTPPPAPEPLETVEATRLYVRGRTAAASGELRAAALELERAFALDPSSAAILEELGRVYGRLGDAARAAECHERLLALRPRDAEALFSSGVAAASRGDLPRAIDRLATLHGLDEAERARGLAGFRPEARTLGDLALARALVTIGADAAALDVLARAAAEASPELPPTWRGDLERSLGDAYARTGDLAAAAAAWERAAAIPESAELVRPRRLWAALRLDRVAAAVAMLEEARGDQATALARWFARMRPSEARALSRRGGDRRMDAALLGADEGRRALESLVTADPDGVPVEVLRERFASVSADAAIDAALRLLDGHPHRAEACATALVRSGATAGGLLAALDRAGRRPGRGVLEPALAAALGDEARLVRVAEAVARGEGHADELAATASAIARLGDETLVEALAARVAASEGLDADRRAAILAALSEAARNAGDFVRARTLAESAVSARRGPETLTALARVRLDAALARPGGDRASLLAEARALVEQATADPAASEASWRLRLAIVDALGDPALRTAARTEARRAHPDSALDRQLRRDALVFEGRVAEALDGAAIRAGEAPCDLDAFRFVVAGVPRTGQGDRLRPWLLDRQLRMPAESESLEALIAVLLASNAEENAFDLLRRRAGAEPPDPFAASLLERALVEKGRAREAFEASRARRDAGAAGTGVRGELRFAALALEAGEPAVAASTLARLVGSDRPLAPGAALAAARLADRLPADVADRDAIVTTLALAAAREGAPERLEAAVLAAGLAARRFERSGTEADRAALAQAVALARAAGSADGWSEESLDAFLAAAQRLADDEQLIAAAELLATTVLDDPALPASAAGRLAVAACALDAAAGGRWERSLGILRRARALGARPFAREGDPAEGEAEAIHRLSGLYSFLDDRLGADRLLERALEVDPDHAMSLNNLAFSAIDRGIVDAETVRRAERAHELVPGDPSILDTLGWLRYKQGRFRDDASGEGAVTLLTRSIRARPDDPGLEPLDHLGDALWRAGDREAAIRAWKAAAELLLVRHPLESIVAGLPEYERTEQGVRLLDPRDFWQRSYGDVGERAARKAATALAGGEPATAPLATPGT